MPSKLSIRKWLAASGLGACLLVLPLSVSAAGLPKKATPTRVVYQWGWGWGPGWGWGYGPPYYWPTTGTLKLKHVNDNDQVFINGAFAGRAKDVESMDLTPGSYHVVVRHNGTDVVNRRVYIALGKTVKLNVADKQQNE